MKTAQDSLAISTATINQLKLSLEEMRLKPDQEKENMKLELDEVKVQLTVSEAGRAADKQEMSQMKVVIYYSLCMDVL